MMITATGCVTPLGNDEKVIWDNLNNKCKGSLNTRVSFDSSLPKRVRRRINRYSDLASCAAFKCMEKIEAHSKERVGCLFTTAFGPLETNLEFAQQIVDDDPDACSPILFSNTVHNACLGTISIELGITGPSTMMLGSNNILLADLLLAENKADVILAGSIDEYNDELQQALIRNGMRTQGIGEAAVVLGLAEDTQEEGFSKVKEIFSYNIGGNPYENCTIDIPELESFLIEVMKEFEIDAIIPNDKCTILGNVELNLLRESRQQVAILDNFYGYFGNCLGADLGLKILVSDLILKNKKIPEGLCQSVTAAKEPKRIAALSADITGNYSVVILEK